MALTPRLLRPARPQSAPALYFIASANNQASNLSNWFQDAAGTIPAVALPTSADDVVFLQDADNTNGVQDFQCRNLSITSKWLTNFDVWRIVAYGTVTLNEAALNDVTIYASVILATNFTSADGNDSGVYLGANSVTLTDFFDSGVVVIDSQNVQLFGEGDFYGISGNATFNGTTALAGYVFGNATFNGSSKNNSIGYWSGDSWEQGVNGNATFNDSAENRGRVGGNATFNNNSVNAFVAFDPANDDFAGVQGNATFNDASNNFGIVEGTITCNTTGVCSVTRRLAPSTSGWTGDGSEANKLTRATLTGTNSNSNTIMISRAGLLRITATTSGVGDGGGGQMTIVVAGQTYTGNSGGSGGSWTVNITKTVSLYRTITFASEYPDGAFTNLQLWIIPPAAPPAPTSLTSPSQSSGSVYLTWAAPENDGGSAITNYAVQYSSNSGSTWTTFSRSASTALNATVTALTNGTSYQFRVAAVNAIGTGSYSSITTATPTSGSSLTASGWSGAGTAASKLAPPASPSTFRSSPSISVATSGTLNVSIVSEDNYNDGYEIIIYRSGSEIYRADGNLNWGSPYTRTFPVTAGQTISLDHSGGGAQWFATTRLWVT